jgi:fused
MAPELVQEMPYDYKADVWSLGCIVFELLTGKPPFYTNSLVQLIKKIIREDISWPVFPDANLEVRLYINERLHLQW